LCLEAESRGWTVVSPHHEAAAGFMAEAASRITGKPAVCFGTLGPGMANMMPAIQCCKVENSPVIFLGGQRARVTERRVRRGRIQFVRQEPMIEDLQVSGAIEYADRSTKSCARRSVLPCRHAGPAYIEYPSHVIMEELE
jgi:thiamine pyrophosphate-dependent acetolactate synthase large subunit-like protein